MSEKILFTHLHTIYVRRFSCKITSSFSDVHQTCNLESRPNVAVLQLQLYCLFFTGIVMSSWCWTHQTLGAWKRYIKKYIRS